MPVRLYRDDSYLTRFAARVEAMADAGEGLIALELDRTAFYPTGGGQPHDTGLIAGLPVVDVREGEGGRVVHIVRAGPSVAPSGEVEGVVDWARRFDHMQQHSGQHILSRAFVQAAGAATRSFHLGASECTIDVDLGQAGEDAVRRAEAIANDIVFSDQQVRVERLPAERAADLAADLSLARELALAPGDPIRIVAIGQYDETPCGGTHVSRTGEVGAVAVRSWERFKGGARITFVCGRRVIAAFAALAATVDACTRRLSAPAADLPAAVDRLQDQVASARRDTRVLSEALAGCEAVALDASARTAGACKVLVEVFAGRSADDLQMLAQKYVLSPARAALLAAVDEGGATASLVFARSAKGMPADLKMGEILSAVCASRGGRGGGGPMLARGGGIPAAGAGAAIEEAWAIVARRLTA